MAGNLHEASGKCSDGLMPWDFWLIFGFLGAIVPWRGYLRLKKLLALPAIDTKERLALYGWTIAFQWAITGFVAWRALARGLTAVEVGIGRNEGPKLLLASIAGAVVLGGIHWLNLRRAGSRSSPASERMRTLARRILPRTNVELLAYCALAVTAGICEEFLYRGFAMAAVFRLGIAAWAVVLLTSVLFGLAHVYQGRGGIVGTALMGLLFGTLRIACDTLIPVMILHATIDMVAGIAGPRYLLTEAEQK